MYELNIMKVSKTLETLRKISDMMSDEERLFFSRFGDGDIFIMSGKGEMCHDKNQDLATELIESIQIKDPRYLKGVSTNYECEKHMKPGMFAPHKNSDELEKILRSFTDENDFESAVAFHYVYCFHKNLFDKFIDDHIRGKRVMYIGCTSKRNMEKLFGPIKYL